MNMQKLLNFLMSRILSLKMMKKSIYKEMLKKSFSFYKNYHFVKNNNKVLFGIYENIGFIRLKSNKIVYNYFVSCSHLFITQI